MKEAVFMRVGKTTEDLVQNSTNAAFWQRFRAVFNELVDVLVKELKYKVQLVIGTDYFLDFDDVVVRQFPQRFDLA